MPHSFQAFLVSITLMFIGFDSRAQTPPILTSTQTNVFAFFDSKSNRFATVTAILPASITQKAAQGKWQGALSSTYVRPKTDDVIASDKLCMTNWHPLFCIRDTEQPSGIVIMLHPKQPDDFVGLKLTALSGTVTGSWHHATDAGVVDSGLFVSTVHK